MHTKIFTAMFLFAAFGATQDVDLNDVPQACQQVCQDISRLSGDCDNQNDNDAAERDCVCNAENAQQQANSCAACVKANVDNNNDRGDEDIRDLFRACNWNYDDVSSTSASETQSSTESSNITTTETIPGTTSTQTTDDTTTTETIPETTVTSTGPAVTTTQTFPESTTTFASDGVTSTGTIPASTITSTRPATPGRDRGS
ncbi:hypothetical protein NUW58_g1959 [Xylaria curta]|uniref:Uncharacterized protein n=1 Tax=Xylaria curta TaxID=42375 RepID=A0ACC1PJU5_9PEZI|nr:hypothetical protein NUW58_g1959 [Xylaria curta]